jgi:undecaprenyl-diphosphatase
MALASASGEPFTLYPLTAIVALHWLTEQRRTAIATLSMALLGSALVNKVVKAMVERPRPRLRLHRQNSSGSSFPSQHLSMSVATYGTLAYLIQQQRPPPAHRSVGRLWAAVVGLCGLMSWSRVYHGVHHPTDILGGWITGSLWYGTCRLVYASLEAQGATNRAPGSHAGGAPAARQETVPSDGITGDRPGAQPDSTKQG